MFRRAWALLRVRPQAPVMYGGVTLFGREFFATEDTPGMTETRRKILEKVADPNESGMDRLEVMFSFDEYGGVSPELSIVKSGLAMGLFAGAVVGAATYAKDAMEKFVRKNTETLYMSQVEAKRALQDQVTLAMMRGGAKWGLKLGAWTGGFLLISLTISTYRNKSGVVEYMVGGAAIGSLFKFHMGPKGMLAGAVVGALGGLFAGLINLGLMLMSGTTMAERRYWLHERRLKDNTEAQYRREVGRRVDKVYSPEQLLHENRLHEEALSRKGLLEKLNKEIADEVSKDRQERAVADSKLDEIKVKIEEFRDNFQKSVEAKLLSSEPSTGAKQQEEDDKEKEAMMEALMKQVETRFQEKEAKKK